MSDDDTLVYRRAGFQACIEAVVYQLEPALIFPRVYRQFLRQECDIASGADSPHARRLLDRIGWSPDYYKDAWESDDEIVDGPWGPQQLLHRLSFPIMRAFPERATEVRARVLMKTINRLGVPNESDERRARQAMLADAEYWFSHPMQEDSNACNHAVRGLADLSAAELGVEIPWSDTSATGLGLRSPNSGLTFATAGGSVVMPRQDRHDVTDRGGLAGAMLEFMCWLPVYGGTHVTDIDMLRNSMSKFLAANHQLQDRKDAVVASLMAIQLCWNEQHIQRAEAALRGRRIPWLRVQKDMHVAALCGIMKGSRNQSPLGGWASVPAQELARRQVVDAISQWRCTREEAARRVLEAHLLQNALLGDGWDGTLQSEAPECHGAITEKINARLSDLTGTTVQPQVAGVIDAEGLPSLAKLAPPPWVAELCEEARRHWNDAEASFIGRLSWSPTPRVPVAPTTWSSILGGFAHAVEAELCFRYVAPRLDELAADVAGHPSEQLKRIRDGFVGGRPSSGALFARLLLSRRTAATSDGGKSPCLGDMQFLLAFRVREDAEDEGVPLIKAIQSPIPYELRLRRNTKILEGINRFRVDSSHPQRADSDRELTQERALLGRRIMVQYLHFLVQCARRSR